jgi:D-beta-D-heptose 7-phosphate kinase/D-beta-D-heptose 1-phosphate adenosyltransferase
MPRPICLVVGDAILDRWVDGEMQRISPEAPAPIVRLRAVRMSPGGAANVAANIKSLGGTVFFAAGINNHSDAAQPLRDMFEQDYGISACWCPGGRVAVKTRIAVAGQQILRLDEEDDRPATGAHADNLLRGLQAVCGPESSLKLLVVSDYNKGCLTPTVSQYLQDVMRSRPLPLFVDAKPARIRQWAGATLLKVNAHEAIQIATEDGYLHPGLSDAASAPEVAADYLRQRYGFANVVVTCGAGGVVYTHGTAVSVPTVPQPIYDVTGAGDTFLAALAVGYLEDMTLEESIFRANVAAGLAVQQHGPKQITRDAWETAVRERRGWAGKIMGIEAVTELVQRKRALGHSVVLANGCFDALHSGHIQLLTHARQQADLLVVAYNDDASIVALKGTGRPIVPEQLRAAHLAMLSFTDCVVRFDGDVEALVRKLHPDVLVKGEQYRSTRVPGADFVAGYGGIVIFAPMLPGLSTTNLGSPQPRSC